MIAGLVFASMLATAAPDEVVVLPFDGVPGISSRDLDVLERGLSIALRRKTKQAPLRGADLEERMADGKGERLGEARSALAEGQMMLAEGDADIGIVFFEEAIAAHEEVLSMIARRDELADAHFELARSMTALGRISEAQPHLEATLRLVPDYLESRAEMPSEAMIASVRMAEKQLAAKPPRRLSYAGALSLRSELAVDHVVHGVVGRPDTVVLHVYPRRGDFVSIPHRIPTPVPPLGDPWYDQLASEVTTVTSAATIP